LGPKNAAEKNFDSISNLEKTTIRSMSKNDSSIHAAAMTIQLCDQPWMTIVALIRNHHPACSMTTGLDDLCVSEVLIHNDHPV
jgi:hypothetical protein